MQRQTFINEMEARGYETTTLPNGNVKAKRGDIILRLVPLANYSVHISTPTVSALTAKPRHRPRNTARNRHPDRPALTAYMRVQVPQGHEKAIYYKEW